MPYAFDTYSGNGSLTDFNISFPYINEDHVKVYVNYTQVSFTFEPNKSTARLASTPPNGAVVEVRRITPLANVLVDYADGSTLTAGDLDTNNLQHLYIEQELDDIQNKAIALSPTTGLATANSRRVTEVADPTAAQDAATKNYVDTTRQPVDAELTELATMSSGTASSLADLTNTEVQILDGATVATAEVNLLDGVTATTAEINYVDGVTSNVQTQLNAKQPLDAELTELATMASDTASSLADLTAAEVQALDGVTASTAELNILDGVTATAAELNTLDGVASTLTAAELNFVDGVTSALQTQLDGKQASDSDLTALSSCQTGAATNIALLTSGEVAILDGATLSTAELNTLSGLTSSTGELNKLDGVTSTATNLNVVSGMTKATSLTSNSDTEFPTSKAVNDRILTVTNALGGFVAISNETSFPTANPDPSNGAGTVVSVSDAGGVVVNGSGVATIANGAGTGNTVTINGFPSALQSKTIAAGIGLQVQTTTTLHTYTYHKALAKEADVEQLSDDINDFNSRYRTATGSNPSSNNDAGDLFFSQDTDKMYVRNAANNAWDEVVSVGEFFINTLSSLGSGSDNPPGGSATFNGQARKFTLSNAPSVAQQLIVSINGVIQKPNSGTSFPSEGFSINGSALQLAAAPATNAPFFIITIGSTVNIGTPSAQTVDLAKLDTSNTGSTGQFLKKDGSTEGIGWADVATAITWTLGINGAANAYTFTGDGFASATDDPDLWLSRGETYKFVNGNSSGTHAFNIEKSDHDGTWSAYTTGMTGAGATGGNTMTWTVPMDAPSLLKYVSGTTAGMTGFIYIADGNNSNEGFECWTGSRVSGLQIDNGPNGSHMAFFGTHPTGYQPTIIGSSGTTTTFQSAAGYDFDKGNINLQSYGTNTTTPATIKFEGGGSDNTYGPTISGPATAQATSNYTITLPGVVPTANGQVLSATTAGVCSWTTPSAGPSLANDANNRVITGTGSGLNGEANLTFDGSQLGVGSSANYGTIGTAAAFQVQGTNTGSNTSINIVNAATSNASSTCDVNAWQDYRLSTRIISGRENASNWTSSSSAAASYLAFYTNSAGTVAERMRVKSDGNVEITDGNLVVASGHGISFAATADSAATGATDTSELFSDYEEGTWTPVLSSGTCTPAMAYYVRCGNMVWITCSIGNISERSSDTEVRITTASLPFNTNISYNNIGPCRHRYTSHAGGYSLTGIIDGNGIYFGSNNDAFGDKAYSQLHYDEIDATYSEIAIAGWYRTGA